MPSNPTSDSSGCETKTTVDKHEVSYKEVDDPLVPVPIEDISDDESIVYEDFQSSKMTKSLMASEECVPILTTKHDFMTSLFNSDPRVAFDVLHINALLILEAIEGLQSSQLIGPQWYVPPAHLKASDIAVGKEVFEVPRLHTHIAERSAIELDVNSVERALRAQTTEELDQIMPMELFATMKKYYRGRNMNKRHRS
ncbi:unnamed protein product [Phytomonas sp. Hart1]|nr:unnamed protein product [Phytomonas sp. Hart1]|eukprot:CCW70253.1 unnamed protein product [Phytomonas sp. isolate Hart1]